MPRRKSTSRAAKPQSPAQSESAPARAANAAGENDLGAKAVPHSHAVDAIKSVTPPTLLHHAQHAPVAGTSSSDDDDELVLQLSDDEKLLPSPSHSAADSASDDSEIDPDIESDDDASPALSSGPEHRRFVIQRDVDKRLDKYLGDRIKGASRNKIQQLIELGGVTVNDRKPKPSLKVHAGDVIDVTLPPRAVKHILPEPIPLTILYEDVHFIVLNKQANLIVHPARGNLSGTLVNGLAHHFITTGQLKPQTPEPPEKSREKPIKGEVAGLSSVGAADFRPGIIHRLDKNTTGVMVVGKSDEAHWQIAKQFEDRTTLKAYLALVHGSLEGVGGVIEEPLGKHPTIREAFAVRNDPAGKHSVTLFRVRERYQGYTLVELELKTGRTHQIRVHLSYIGFPIVGDIVYGGEPIGTAELDKPVIPAGARRNLTFARERAVGQALEIKAKTRKDLLLAHPALHAGLLRFTHPITLQQMTFTAPLHEPFASLIRELRKRPAPGSGLDNNPVATSGYWIDLNQAIPN
jgi:23S rRNA pseudouridine1911/1915/1917 synthase